MPSQKKDKDGLSLFELRFCKEYLTDFNQTRAYLAVSPEVTPGSASTLAGKLLQRVGVRSYLRALIEKATAGMDLTAARVLKELARLCFISVDDVIEWTLTGNAILQASADLSPDVKAAIKTIKRYQRNIGTAKSPQWTDVIEVEFYDKLKALELASRHLGLLNDRLPGAFDVSVHYHIGSKPTKPLNSGTSGAAEIGQAEVVDSESQSEGQGLSDRL